MKTVQMTLEEGLLQQVDRVVHELHTTRSAFTRQALQQALERLEAKRAEERHQRGYRQQPVKPGEFDGWEDEQVWGG